MSIANHIDWDDLPDYSNEELDALENRILCDLDAIKQQLFLAKSKAAAHKEYSDPDWFTRTMSACRHKSLDKQAVQRERRRRREEKERQKKESLPSQDRLFILKLQEAMLEYMDDSQRKMIFVRAAELLRMSNSVHDTQSIALQQSV